MKKSIIRKYLYLSILAGIIMGAVFPFFARIFMISKSETAYLLFTISCVGAGIIVGLVSAGIGNITIIKTIDRLNFYVNEIGKGNFSTECKIESDDKIGELITNFNEMKNSLELMIKTISERSDIIDRTLKDNTEGLLTLHDRIKEIHYYAESVSKESEKVSNVSNLLHSESSEIENAVKSLAGKAAESADESASITKRAFAAKKDVTESIEAADRLLLENKEKLEAAIQNALAVDEIKLLAEAIAQISSRTNTLSLNASIEANRSGESGKGFSVIAQEIRNLSESSKSHTENISKVINDVTVAVKELIAAAQKLLEFISNNVNRDYRRFSEVLDEYEDNSQFINSLASDFSSTSQELFASLMEIFDQVKEIDASALNSSRQVNEIFREVQVLNENSDTLVEETKILSESTHYLKESVAKFHLGK